MCTSTTQTSPGLSEALAPVLPALNLTGVHSLVAWERTETTVWTETPELPPAPSQHRVADKNNSYPLLPEEGKS